ncbi:hypothetical protein ACFL5V_04375 [Fibrobacterota bacterium]
MLRTVLLCCRILLIPLLAVILFLSCKVLLSQIPVEDNGVSLALLTHPFLLSLVFGLGSRTGLHYFCKLKGYANPLEFIDTLEHELTHALFGYLTLSPPISLFATLEAGGEVRLKRQNVLVALSPYFFPLFGSLTLSIGFLIKDPLQPYWNLIPFALFGSFLYRLGIEFRWYQSDLKLYGRVFSTFLTGFLLLCTLTVVMHITGIMKWWWVKDIWPEIMGLVEQAHISE